jgi:lipid II:glycine glycyltransferase (peptidoglycan interpeptide bridge formation enzyme)
MQIFHLRHNEIDFRLWDYALSKSINQFGYAYSWYLNIVSPGWEALITKNYEYIMPLPVKRKYGIPYIVQPVLTQQLGIFSDSQITKEIIQQFISAIPYYSYEINLNDCNAGQTEIIERTNFVLPLHKSHEELVNEYSKNTVRNIHRAEKTGLFVDEEVGKDEFVSFYFSIEKNYTNTREDLLRKLLNEGTGHGLIKIPGIRNIENKIIAALCILKSERRIIYLVPVSNDEGKKSSAMFLLLDNIIKANAASECLLDFEGSEIAGIARFYKGFGAVNRPYYVIKKFRPAFLVGKI